MFLKPHGVARGTLTVADDLPAELRVGFLEAARTRPGGLTAWVRFSSDTVPGSSDLKTTLGVGIKLFGVPGPKLLEADTEADTQDLLLQNHDVFFVDTAQDMCEFTKAGVVDGSYDPYLEAHPVAREILDAMAKFEESTLTADYWGVLPYAFGPDRYVKYKLVPAGCEPGDPKRRRPTRTRPTSAPTCPTGWRPVRRPSTCCSSSAPMTSGCRWTGRPCAGRSPRAPP